MADPFYGEIRAFGFDFAPANWAFCAGQTIQIQQNSALYSVICAQFGGNGTTNFALPNLQGNAPMGSGTAPGLTPRDVGDTVGTTQETSRAIAAAVPRPVRAWSCPRRSP